MKLLLAFLLCATLHADTPTLVPTRPHKRPVLRYDKAANQALHDKMMAKREAGKNEVLADMQKQLDALGNSGNGAVDLTYWKAHRRDAVRSLRPRQRHAVMGFYRILEQYEAMGSAATARAKAHPDASKVKAALEMRLRQAGLDREMIAKKP